MHRSARRKRLLSDDVLPVTVVYESSWSLALNLTHVGGRDHCGRD